MKKEQKFKAIQYKIGYLDALKDVLDRLWPRHHERGAQWDRYLIDSIHQDIKELEDKIRRNRYP